MNQTLVLLLEASDSEDEEATLRALAYRVGLLWHCDACNLDNPGDLTCEQCRMPPPEDTPEAPRLMVTAVVSKATGVPVAVYDTDGVDGAGPVVEWFNEAHEGELVTLAPLTLPHNMRPNEYLLEHFCTVMPEHRYDDTDADAA